MATRGRTSLKNLYGATGTEFPDNTTRLIEESTMRSQGEDLSDSLFNLTDDAYTGAKGIFPDIDTITGLKAIPTLPLAWNVVVLFRDADSDGKLRVYQLINDTAAEVSPTIIRPDDYDAFTNNAVWKLAISADEGTIQALTDGASIAWDMQDLLSPEAELNTSRTSFTLDLQNFRAGGHAKLLIFKNSASDLTITFNYNGDGSTPVFLMPEVSGDLHTGLVLSTPANTFVQLVFDNHNGTSFNCVIVTKQST